MEENQNEPVLDVTQDQEELDIFLFTNGEKQTPPRKHHISANELRSWNNAMHILAQSQFGSEPQTMELYTTSGCKVEDPAQIQNFGAYVAVKPEETFVDAGYDKYLIKATRSRERRQSKKNSIVEPVEPDSNVIQRKQSSTECIKDTVNVQTTDHDLAIETVFSHKMLETQISKNNNILKISLTNDTAPPVESRKSSLKPDIAALADEKNSPPTQVSLHPNALQKIPQLHPSDPPITPKLRRQISPVRSTKLSRNRNAYNANVLSIKNQPKMPDKHTRKFTKVSKKVDDRNTSFLGIRHSNITDSSSSIVSTPNKTKLPSRPRVHERAVTNCKKISSRNTLQNVQEDDSCYNPKTINEDGTQKMFTRNLTKIVDFPQLDDLIINKDLIVFAAVRPKRTESITPATDTSFGTERNYEASEEDIETTNTCCAIDSMEQNKKKQKKENKRSVSKSEKIKHVEAGSKFQPKVLHPTKKKQQPIVPDDIYLKKQLLGHTDEFLNTNKDLLSHNTIELATAKHQGLKSNFKTQESQIENRQQQVKKALLKELQRSPERLNNKNKNREDYVMRPTTKSHPKTPFKSQTIKPFLKTNTSLNKKETISSGKPKEPKPLSQTAPTLLKKSHPSASTIKAPLDKNQSSSNRCETPTSARFRPYTGVMTPTPVQNKITFEKNTKMSDKYTERNSEPNTERKIRIVTQNRQHDPNHKISFYNQPKAKHDTPLEGNFKADNFGKFQLSVTIPNESSHDDTVEISAENYRRPLYNTTSHNALRQFKPSNEIPRDNDRESKEWQTFTDECRQSEPFHDEVQENNCQSNAETKEHENREPFQQMEPEYIQGSGQQVFYDHPKSETSFIQLFSDIQKQPETSKKTPLGNEKQSASSKVSKQRQSELVAFSTALEKNKSATHVQKHKLDYLPILTAEIRPLNSFSSNPNSTPKFVKHRLLKPISLLPENHVEPKICNLPIFKPLSHTSDPYKSHIKSMSQTQSNKSLQPSSISEISYGASHQTQHCFPEKFESVCEAIQNNKRHSCKGDHSESKLPENDLTDNLDMDCLQSLFNSTPGDKIAQMEKGFTFSATPLPVSGVELITDQKKEITFEYKLPQSQEQVSVLMEPTPLITIKNNMEQGTPSSSVTLAMQHEETLTESSLLQDDNIIADETGVVKQSIDLRRSNSDTGVIEKYKSKTKNNGNEMLTQSKSLQSMVNELPDHICCQKFPKVVVVQCGCCKIGANDGVNHTCKMDSILNSNNHECYVVIPVSSLPFCECHKESQCCSHTANKQTQNSESLAKLKVDNPVKNISANTSMTPNGDAQNLALSSLCQVYVGNDQNATKYQTVMDNETFHTEVMIMRTDLLQNESHCEHFERRISFKPADFTEKYTQTDWCDVLLEIRGHPDGHYTFHLPSLQLLRLYNLI